MITSFPSNPAQNLAGNSSFKYLPLLFLSVLPPAGNKIINTPVTCIPGTGFLDGYSTQGQLTFNETPTLNENGPVYACEITGFYPGDSDVIADLFEEMEQSRHLVLIRDQNDRLRLAGYNAPLDFISKYSSGTTPGDPKGYTFSFTGNSITRAPFYRVG